jgi:hypothetical protein
MPSSDYALLRALERGQICSNRRIPPLSSPATCERDEGRSSQSGLFSPATDRRSQRAVESIEQRTAGDPAMAIVSLHSQRITVAASAGDQAALMLLRKDST